MPTYQGAYTPRKASDKRLVGIIKPLPRKMRHGNRQPLAKIGFLLVLIKCTAAAAWYISPPEQPSDWSKLSRLVVDSFDAPLDDAPWLDKARWFLIEKDQAERAAFRQYVGTAKKLKDAKYSILLAKEKGEVIGLAEVGIPVFNDTAKPTLGALCVSKDYRKQGIGAALVVHCQSLVTDVWKDDTLYAQVEEGNPKAIAFFKAVGFRVEDSGIQMVGIRYRLKVEQRPCLLLSHELTK
jgi:ribosomal protein S18 acetylase RimI-like enzyme